MLKISRKHSVNLSLCIAAIFFLLLLACAALLPLIITPLVSYANESSLLPPLFPASQAPMLILAYLVVATMMLADVLLVVLLLHVKREEVFCARAVSLIRRISWCCFLLGVWFAAIAVWFQLSLVAAVAAIFLGLCLRVCKNAFEEATLIKSENDLTV